MRSSVRYGRVDSMETMLAFLEKIGNYLMLVRLTDILDVAIIAFLVYKLLDLVKSTRAENILKGVVMFLLALWLAEIFHLNGIAYILGNMVQVGILALIILFQPEIRQILEKLGSKNIRLLRAFTPAQQQSEVEKAIDQTVIACKEMSQSKTGVLIVFERHILLDDMVRSGTTLDAAVSSELLKNIFFVKAPMHDGAVIIRHGRILGAGCMLPLSKNVNLSRDLGMRHRAGIGMSENSDAVVVIVSEETGSISVAIGGMLKRHLMPETLSKLLRNELMPQPEELEDKPRRSLADLLGLRRKEGDKVLQVIASILVAVAIWVYVDVEKAPERTKTIRDIPVEFSGESTTLADKNLMLLSGYDTTVDLTIKGTKRELVKINKDNVRLVASTSSIDSVGVHTLRWDVVYPDGVQSSALSVDWASKYKVTVTVGELYTKEVPVNCVVTGTVADGYFTGETVLDPTTLVLRGQRDDLLNVAYAKLTVDISDATRSVIQTESVQLYDNDDNPVDNSNIRTNASLIQAKVPVLTTKEVSLAVELSGVPGSAGQSIKTTITPSSVRLIGEADVLENIDEIVLATLYIEDLDIWQQNSYVVTAPDGTWLANSNEVATVEITMEGIEEKTVTVDTFSYTNVPSGLYAEVQDTLDVRLWGLSEELAELKADAITATVDLSSVTETGSCRVPVTVTVSGYRDVAVKGSYEVTVYVTDTQPEPEPEPDGGLTSHGNNGSGNEN